MIVVILLISFAIIYGIARKLIKKYWSKGVTAFVSFKDAVVNEGDRGEIVELITNEGWLPLPVLTVRFELDRTIHYEEKEHVAVSDFVYRNDTMSVRRHESVARSFYVTYKKRGIYAIDRVSLESLGLYAHSRYFEQYEQHSEIYVYPAYSHYVDVVAPFSRIMGEAIRKHFMYEDPFEFRGIRDYTGMEPMKKINWSASARTGELKVNQYYDTTSRSVTILLDISNDQIWVLDRQLEEAIRITRNYIEGFVKNHIPVTLITNGRDIFEDEEIEPSTGADAVFVDMVLKKLTRIDVSKKTRSMRTILAQEQAKEDQLTVLLSTDLSKELSESYSHYLGNSDGEWLALLPVGAEHKRFHHNIHMTYVEVGR